MHARENRRTTVLCLGFVLLLPAMLPAQSDNRLSEGELDTLLAPIALYPDPLLAQLLPAATYPDDIRKASEWLARHSAGGSEIDNQQWDLSVRAIAHYPQVVRMMANDMDWTESLGQAFAMQPQDVMNSVQHLRARARTSGALEDSREQRVVVEREVIKIVPSQPEVIYVPQYNPQVIYAENRPSTGERIAAGLITFGAGVAVGAWLNNDCDWGGSHGWGVYYHGWSGPGWWGARRPGWAYGNSLYINDSYRRRAWVNPRYGNNITINRNYVQRNRNFYNFDRNRTIQDNRFRNSNWGNSSSERRLSTPERNEAVRERLRNADSSRGAYRSPNGAFSGYDRGSRTSAASGRGWSSAGRTPPHHSRAASPREISGTKGRSLGKSRGR